MQTYYLVLFLLSAALSGVYMFLWRRYFDVHITLIFTLVLIAIIIWAAGDAFCRRDIT